MPVTFFDALTSYCFGPPKTIKRPPADDQYALGAPTVGQISTDHVTAHGDSSPRLINKNVVNAGHLPQIDEHSDRRNDDGLHIHSKSLPASPTRFIANSHREQLDYLRFQGVRHAEAFRRLSADITMQRASSLDPSLPALSARPLEHTPSE